MTHVKACALSPLRNIFNSLVTPYDHGRFVAEIPKYLNISHNISWSELLRKRASPLPFLFHSVGVTVWANLFTIVRVPALSNSCTDD